jgi:hypothetical protein
MKKLIVIAAVAVLLVGCMRSSRNVKLTVVNESATAPTNIDAAGSGFSAPKTQIPLKSDTAALKLEFGANGKHFSEVSSKDPWNGMKEVIMTIMTNFSVKYESVTTF